MQNNLVETMKHFWPHAWSQVLAIYDGTVPFQGWLNANVVWAAGAQPPTAAEIEAKTIEYDAVLLDRKKQEVCAAIKSETEARIANGAIINGHQIKCDDRSMARIHGMVTAGGRKGVGYSRKFRTASGVTLTLNKAQAEALFDTAESHVALMLDKSATLQETALAMTEAELAVFNAADPVHWA